MTKQHFVENILVSPGQYQKQPLNESVSLHINEAGSDKTYKAKAVYTFPISRPDQKNLNNRIYTSKLWEKVIKEKQAEGCYGLMDHPDDDGSTKNAWCVWRNLRFSEDRKLVLADAYLFGFWGQQALEALEAGGSIGLSSSGWGDFKDDDITLNEDTFVLERMADWVLNPSYEVFGHQEDLKALVNANESISGGKRIDYDDSFVKVYKDGKEIYSGIEDYEPMKNADWKWDNDHKYYTYKDMIKVCLENLENSPKQNKEIVMENTKSTVSPSIEEKSLLFNIKAMFKEAKQVENVFERLDGYNSLLSYFNESLSVSGSAIKEEIETSINEDNEFIKKCVAEHNDLTSKITDLEEKYNELTSSFNEANEKLEVVSNENADLEKKYNESCEMLDNFKTYALKQKEIVRTLEAEKNGMVSPKEYKESIVYSQSLEEEIQNLKNELHEAKKCKKEDDDDDVKKDDPEDDDANDDGKGDDEKDDLEKMDDKKESFVNESVKDYYDDLVYRNSKVSIIKEDIMKCKTVLEAQMTYLRLKGLVEDSANTYYDRAVYAQTRKATKEETQYKRSALREGWL